MGKYEHQAVSLSRAVANRVLAEMMIAETGNIKVVYIKTDVPPLVASPVEVLLNGASIYSDPSGRPNVAVGTGIVNQTGLTFPAVKGDIVKVVMPTSVSSNKEFGPKTYVQVQVNDGASVGTGIVETIVAGANVSVDDSDPANPIVSSTGGGGGGGGTVGIFSPDVPYATPSAVDDEFDGGSLDSKWDTDVALPTLNFDIPSQLGISSSTGLGDITGIKQNVSNVDASWRMKVIPGRGNSGAFGFSVKASGGTHYRTTYQYTTNAGTFAWGEWVISPAGVYASHEGLETFPANGIEIAALYLEIQYIAASHTVIFRYSTDGINFKDLATSNTISSTDIVWVGIFANSSVGQLHRIEWFRKLQGNHTGGMI